MRRTEIEAALAGQIAEVLRARGPLAGLPLETLANFVRLGALTELAPGDALMREGEAAVEFYLLLEGALVVQSQGGIVARLDKPGEVAGEAAVLLKTRRTADVVAESAVRAVAIPAGLLPMPEFAEVTAGIRSAMLRDDWVEY